MKNLARLAAAADAREGGFRTGLNIAAQLEWATRTRLEHGPCGQLSPERDEQGLIVSARCPVHGSLPAPEWKAAP